MRNLTIKREKRFVGSLVKMKIYIEDPTAKELIINKTPCRKIGDLKNGEQKTFQIADQAAKVFVIADKLSKDYCNEYYQLPEGQEDIFLSGKNKYNPANGNAFVFDNNQSEGIAENRKRGKRKGIVVLLVAAVVGAIVGFLLTSGLLFPKTSKEKTFSSDGMTITLTDAFRETDIANQTVAYDSRKVAVFALKEAFSLADGFEDYTLDAYADLVQQNNGLTSSVVKNTDGLKWFTYEYTNPDTKDTYQYVSFVFKTDDAFWLIQFATLEEDFEEYDAQIMEWAKTISFE